MAKRKKTTWDLSVSYNSERYWDGGDSEIETIAGKEAHSSGMALYKGGTRDLQFSFDTQEEAKDIAKKIRSKCRKFVKSVKIFKFDGEHYVGI
jgi:hypothetical protein